MEINLKNKKRHWLILISFLTEKNDAIRWLLLDDYISMILKPKVKEEPKPEPIKAKTKRKKSPFELHKKCINEIRK